MRYKEFVEWMAFYQSEPFGEEANYLRAGIVASTIANCNRGEKQEPFSATDFMPFYNGAKPLAEPLYDPNPEAQSTLLEAFFNGVSSTA